MKLKLVEAALLQLMHELGTDSTVKEVPAQGYNDSTDSVSDRLHAVLWMHFRPCRDFSIST